MEIWELFLLAAALSMDAFAVSVCKGLETRGRALRTGLVCGLWFGLFQALMPLIGWTLGSAVSQYIGKYSAYVAFALLLFLGIRMLREAVKGLREARRTREAAESGQSAGDCENKGASPLAFGTMLLFAVATSVDALAAGLTLAAVGAEIWTAVALIGGTTFLFSFAGAAAGARIGSRFKSGAEILGGVILIGIGLKILIEHLVSSL